MREELRTICKREIARLNDLSEQGKLESEDYTNLQKLVSALKVLEESKTPEEDDLVRALRVADTKDILAILDATERD